MIRAMVLALTGLSMSAAAADDFKVAQLEQDVRELRRQVQQLSQQLESQRAPAAQVVPPRPESAPRAVSGGPPLWIDAAKWRRLQPGMPEMEVIASLGPPTSMRTEGDQRILLYALEIGASGFLGGSVTLRDRSVVSVRMPVLQ